MQLTDDKCQQVGAHPRCRLKEVEVGFWILDFRTGILERTVRPGSVTVSDQTSPWLLAHRYTGRLRGRGVIQIVSRVSLSLHHPVRSSPGVETMHRVSDRTAKFDRDTVISRRQPITNL